MGPFPEPPPAVPATSDAERKAKLTRVATSKRHWLGKGIPERIAYLESCMAATEEVASAWVHDMCLLKGIHPDEPLAGEEWIAGPLFVMRNARMLIETLRAGGQRKPPAQHVRANGQMVMRVLPEDLHDTLEFRNTTADVWIAQGKPPSQGRIYREPADGPGTLALVLGAGNLSSIPAMDVLHKLFVDDSVVVLKMSPINAAVGPHFEKVFARLIADGFLAIVYGDGEVGAQLAQDPLVDTLHVTGSAATYDAIVWGPDAQDRSKRKAAEWLRNARPFTAELGAVTPVLVVPGAWSEEELQFQARHVTAMVTHNASFNCNAAKVLVTSRQWAQRDAFLACLRAEFRHARPRKAYYPGAQTRYARFMQRYPQAEVLGQSGEGVIPWTLIPNVSERAEELALREEAFCGLLAEVPIDAKTPQDFLERAVAFANEKCAGTLSCSVLIDTHTEKACAVELDAAIAALRYGDIGINVWPGAIFALCSTTWGAFPGHTPEAIGSGVGVVHNTFLFDYPEKSVVHCPFMPNMTPGYFPDHRALDRLGKAMLEMEAHLGPRAFMHLIMAAMRD